MLQDRVSNPGPLTYESGALPIALRGPSCKEGDSSTGWERIGQMLCIVDISLSVLMTFRMCLRELCCLFTVWI